MLISNLQQILNNINYWNAKVLDFRSEIFGDECRLFIEINGCDCSKFCWEILFKRCYIVEYEINEYNEFFKSNTNGEKYIISEQFNNLSSKLMKNIVVKEYPINELIQVNIIITNMLITIICQDIQISKVIREQVF